MVQKWENKKFFIHSLIKAQDRKLSSIFYSPFYGGHLCLAGLNIFSLTLWHILEVSSIARVTSVKFSIGIITHQGHISQFGWRSLTQWQHRFQSVWWRKKSTEFITLETSSRDVTVMQLLVFVMKREPVGYCNKLSINYLNLKTLEVVALFGGSSKLHDGQQRNHGTLIFR